MEQTMLDIVSDLLAKDDLNDMLTSAIDHAIVHCDADHGMILLQDEETGISVEIARKRNGSLSKRPWSHISRSVVSEAMKNGDAICLEDAMKSRYVQRDGSAVLKRLRSVCCVPLLRHKRKYGVLYLENRQKTGAFDSRKYNFLVEYARFISRAAFRAYSHRKLEERLRVADARLQSGFDFSGIVGYDPGFTAILSTVKQVAPTDSTVLILGESGTGKELIAKALHRNSLRKDGPFITINCGALSESLIVSELFGHKRGAFTGATADKQGWFTRADGGTVFLDEIAELPRALQVKLLRVLQSGEYSALGSANVLKTDARVLAATNQNLHKFVEQGKFREDLFYRLSVVDITVPPLRDRKSDLPYLIQYFLKKHATESRGILRLGSEVERLLLNYHFPGNVRELENLIERFAVLAREQTIRMDLVPVHMLATEGSGPDYGKGRSLKDAKQAAALDAERAFITESLKSAKGNISRAAKLAGVDASNFHKLIRKHKIDVRRFKD